jgi:hypothetical protein
MSNLSVAFIIKSTVAHDFVNSEILKIKKKNGYDFIVRENKFKKCTCHTYNYLCTWDHGYKEKKSHTFKKVLILVGSYSTRTNTKPHDEYDSSLP